MSNNADVCLALFFDAPLLSFGGECKFDHRDTLGFPSRGAVTGLVAAALGIDRGDRFGLERLSRLRMSSIAFLNHPGMLLEDYHTIGGGYPSGNRDIPADAAGKSRGTVLTERCYMADGKFAALLSGDAAFLEEIGTALRDPVWGGWIGRKHCIPATPVFQGIYPSEEEALAKLKSLAGNSALRIWQECSPEDPRAVLYSDIPLDFARREFRRRAIMEC